MTEFQIIVITSLSFHVFSNFSKKDKRHVFFSIQKEMIIIIFKKLFDKGEEGISPFPSILCQVTMMKLFLSGQRLLIEKRLQFISQRMRNNLLGHVQLFIILSSSVVKNAAYIHRPTLSNFPLLLKSSFALPKV